jgi:hypothetical protein
VIEVPFFLQFYAFDSLPKIIDEFVNVVHCRLRGDVESAVQAEDSHDLPQTLQGILRLRRYRGEQIADLGGLFLVELRGDLALDDYSREVMRCYVMEFPCHLATFMNYDFLSMPSMFVLQCREATMELKYLRSII